MKIRLVIATIGVALLSGACAENADPGPVREDRSDALAEHLLPSVIFSTEEPGTMRMEDRMAYYNVPGVSVAVIEDGAVEWARGWGVADSTTGVPVTRETRFQAASISKPLTAAAFVSLADDGLASLDTDINTYLDGWTIEADPPLTAAEILSHSAGLSVSGFPGYGEGDALPTLIEVLNGTPPANTDAVTYDAGDRGSFHYSGGGFEIIQKAIEDITGQPFADVMEARVLGPAGMTHSTYHFPTREADGFSSGHSRSGVPIEGRWHDYPELAAAGLWTTAEDLATFALNIIGYSQTGERIVSAEAGADMLEERIPETALGFWIMPGVTATGVYHTGRNEGFQSNLFMFEDGSHGVVILTNNEVSTGFIYEIIRGVSDLYDWPEFHKPGRREVLDLPSGLVESLVGTYERRTAAGVIRLAVDWDGETLGFDSAESGARETLFLVEPGMFMTHGGATHGGRFLSFDVPDGAGPVSAIRFGLGQGNDVELLRVTNQ